MANERKTRSDKGGSYPINFVHSKHENVFVGGNHKNKLPPLEILNFLFRYDIETGKLYRIRGANGRLWNPERGITADSGRGYLAASIRDSNGLQKLFLVHQIIYYMHTGVEPLSIVDHINGIKTDNRFSNLRLATESGNSRNSKMRSDNTSGTCGVHWYKPTRKWVAYAKDNSGKRKHLGYFDNKEEAKRVITAYYSNPINNFSDRHGLPLSPLGC